MGGKPTTEPEETAADTANAEMQKGKRRQVYTTEDSRRMEELKKVLRTRKDVRIRKTGREH